ncbi:MAG: aminoglycoside 6-adenylyltransferase [Oscillospiraceae bacterium]|nr:aminoglycoside 6-adenylyltransferase [Oscillospiraceae bacterium]
MNKTDRYRDIKKRLSDIAKTDETLKAVIAIGSSVRSCSAADEYSDIDLIIAATDTEKWLYGDMPSMLGEIKISFVEPTLGGGLERRMLYDGSLDVDLIVFTPEQLISAVENGAAAEVMNRGYLIMHDAMGISAPINERIKLGTRTVEMTDSEFANKVNDFWFHTVWAAKKILRGELWCAKMCIDAYLKNHLLSIIELDRYCPDKTDVWHSGRFFEQWAGGENVSALENCFAHYNRADMITALKNTAKLFSKIAKSAAKTCGFSYPENAENYAQRLLAEYFPE